MVVPESSLLFTRARGGSAEAIGAIFERYGDRLHALIRLRLGPNLRRRLESRDILQATLLKAFQGIERFDGTSSRSLMAWLGAIARTEIYDQADFHGRKKRDAGRETSLDQKVERVADAVRTQASRLRLEEESERLERAIDALSEDHREVILLRSFEELSFPEVGERLGKTPDASRMLFARAMAALTLKMQESS